MRRIPTDSDGSLRRQFIDDVADALDGTPRNIADFGTVLFAWGWDPTIGEILDAMSILICAGVAELHAQKHTCGKWSRKSDAQHAGPNS